MISPNMGSDIIKTNNNFLSSNPNFQFDNDEGDIQNSVYDSNNNNGPMIMGNIT